MKTIFHVPKQPKSIAIAGVTGAVGKEILQILEDISFPISHLKLLASARSAGKKVLFHNKEYIIEHMQPNSFDDIDIALFSCGSSITKEFTKYVTDAGATLIDNSSAFRMDPNVPLVIPEINPQAIKPQHKIIANPNCSTIIMLMAIYPIHQEFPISEIIVSTYQAVSGAGLSAMHELQDSTLAYLQDQPFETKVFPFSTAFNLFSHNSKINLSGYNEEEIKMIRESHKILQTQINISPTCIRVPVLRTHAESIFLKFSSRTPSPKQATQLLQKFPGIQIVDNQKENHFPMPLEASKKYECFVGRLRNSYQSTGSSLEMFVVGDQLLKGAALNAVQIACLI